MTFNSPTNPAIVWTNTTRTLTGGGGAFITNHGGDNNTLANGSTANFTTPAGIMELLTVVGIATANATYNFGLTNGVTFRQGTTGVSGAAAMFHAACNSSEGLAINNSGTVSGAYSFAGVRFSS